MSGNLTLVRAAKRAVTLAHAINAACKRRTAVRFAHVSIAFAGDVAIAAVGVAEDFGAAAVAAASVADQARAVCRRGRGHHSVWAF